MPRTSKTKKTKKKPLPTPVSTDLLIYRDTFDFYSDDGQKFTHETKIWKELKDDGAS